jgi:hypothetical protein
LLTDLLHKGLDREEFTLFVVQMLGRVEISRKGGFLKKEVLCHGDVLHIRRALKFKA